MKKKDVQITTRNTEETFQLGKHFVSFLSKGDVVALYGELGSGKTVFVKGACSGLGIEKEVTSPSFILMQKYIGKVQVYHFDFYRITSEPEIEALDIENYFYSDGISFIEWPEIADFLLPESTFKIFFKRSIKNNNVVEGVRVITITVPRNRRISGYESFGS
ncbi:MAG: tRNA (adenosine(37)-N6)-threonylcarbamoyltransferase complex ATPase subunit type 1 TsaE [bacterium]